MNRRDFPAGKFGAILADPAWRYETWDKATAVTKRASKTTDAETHYRTMTTREIAAIPVRSLAADNCCLFLWVPWPLLEQGLSVMNAWGFQFKTAAFDWMKIRDGRPQIGLGHWTRSNTEPCLLGTRGHPRRLARDVQMAIAEPRREHSRKPECVHDRIERLVAGPYIELWARQSTRPGWKFWGNEAKKYNGG